MLATCLFAMAAVQDPSGNLTLETPALNAPAVVQMVAQAAGRNLAVSPDMASEILLLKLKDADVQGALDRIAKVTLGQWVDRSGTLTLMPDPAARRASSEKALADEMARMDNVLKQWENPRSYDQDYDDMSEEDIKQMKAMLEVEMASQKAFAQVLRSIGTRRLAAMLPGERVVYSDYPTAAQRRLNTGWASFYNVMKLRKDSGVFDFEGEGYEGEFPPEMAEFMALQQALADQVKPFDGVPVKFLLAVSRGSNTSGYGGGATPPVMVNLFAMDKNGSATYVTSISFDVYSDMPYEAEGVLPPGETLEQEPPPEAQVKGRPITFTPEERKLGQGLYNGGMEPDTVKMILDSFQDQTKDQLDLFGGMILRRLGESGDLDVVANVPDAINQLRYIIAAPNEGNTIEAVSETLKYSGSIAEEADGWYTVTPADYNSYALYRMDRPTLANFAASIRQTPVPPLDVTAEFLFRNPYAGTNAIYQLLNDMTPMANTWFGNDNKAIMRFWGSLSDGQRRTLRRGQMLSIGTLSKASRDLLSTQVYCQELPLKHPDPALLAAYPPPARSLLNMFMFGGSGMMGTRSWVTEPTESLPQGLPQNGQIKLDSWSEVCFVQELGPSNPMMPGVLGATEMIMLDAFKQAAPAEAQESLNALPTQATVGTRTNMMLTFGFTPQVQASGPLVDIQLSADRRKASLASLPQDLRDSIATTRKDMSVLENFMKYIIGAMGDGGGAGHRPPP